MGLIELLRLVIVAQVIGTLFVLDLLECDSPFITMFTYFVITGITIVVLLGIFKIVGVC